MSFAKQVTRDAHVLAARWYLDRAHSIGYYADTIEKKRTALALARVHYRKALGL